MNKSTTGPTGFEVNHVWHKRQCVVSARGTGRTAQITRPLASEQWDIVFGSKIDDKIVHIELTGVADNRDTVLGIATDYVTNGNWPSPSIFAAVLKLRQQEIKLEDKLRIQLGRRLGR